MKRIGSFQKCALDYGLIKKNRSDRKINMNFIQSEKKFEGEFMTKDIDNDEFLKKLKMENKKII